MRPLETGDLIIGGEPVAPGETRDLAFKISENYLGGPVTTPAWVTRAHDLGPTVLLLAAIHGDELNGVGIVREIMFSQTPLIRGSLVCAPIVNVFGFENHSRYLPDRRDLNRSFPGSPDGSLAYRMAHHIFEDLVLRCDYVIDLHTAARRRTNYPHIRADLRIPEARDLAFAFGCELILNKKGDASTLRAEACKQGRPTILYEAGEALKFEPDVIETGTRGVLNVLRQLGMVEGEPQKPRYQTAVNRTLWVRAESGGILHFQKRLGDFVEKGETIAISESLFSLSTQSIISPVNGVVLGMTTLPAVKPGEPITHLASPSIPIKRLRKMLDSA